MKKTLVAIFMVLIICVSAMLTGCNDKPENFEVMKSTFAFGTDGQHFTPAVELYVGETVYMALEIKVNAYAKNGKQAGKNEVTCTLTIPKVNAVDAYYYNGQTITPVKDVLTGDTKYTFTIGTNTTKTEGERFIFKFVPAEAGSVRMDLTFSEEVPERYNAFKIIDFVDNAYEE